MKRIIFTSILLFISSSIFSQIYINGAKFDVSDRHYIEVSYYNNIFLKGAYLKANSSVGISSTQVFTDSLKKTLSFKSRSDFFNYLYKQGWKYVEAVENSTSSEGYYNTSFIFEKRE